MLFTYYTKHYLLLKWMPQNPQATEDSAAGTGSLREEECGILVRGRLYNPLQRIFIYITRDRKMQDEVRFLKLTGSFNSKCYTQSTRFLKKKGRKKKKFNIRGLKIKNTSRTQTSLSLELRNMYKVCSEYYTGFSS